MTQFGQGVADGLSASPLQWHVMRRLSPLLLVVLSLLTGWLHAEKTDAPVATIPALPATRGGQDLVGKRMPELRLHWATPQDKTAADAKPPVTLYRWWTESCPYCEATFPALEMLRKEYEPKGLRIVAIYHPKPPRAVTDEAVLAGAEKRSFHGIVAVDQDWSQLKKAWLSTGDRHATSVSILVDRDGIIRFVHPGVMYFPKEQRKDVEPNRDYELLDQAIQSLLPEKAKPVTPAAAPSPPRGSPPDRSSP